MMNESVSTNYIENNLPNNNQSKQPSYKMIRVIGEGTSGKACLVENLTEKCLCVIKIINIENMSEEERKSTFIEAKILSKLDHPSIIKFREVFISKKPRYTLNLVTEFAEGGDLQSKLKARKGKPFPENQILDWFTQICLGIKHIHDRKIIHRDIKSQNIFLGENGLIKIGDFGIAKCLEWTWQKAATLVGTPYYLSPEIVQNQPYSFKSDVWSLGVLLYEMVTLKMPFDATSLPMLSIRIIKGNFNPVPQSFSKEIRNLINNLLTVDSNRRPSINDLLKHPLIKTRIKAFLNEVEYNKEFSHTIIHNYNILKSKKEPDIPVQPVAKNSAQTKTPYKTNIESSNNLNYKNNAPKSTLNLNTNSNAPFSTNSENERKNSKTPLSKPKVPSQEKKKEDNKEISDFFQKNDQKKKKQNDTPSRYLNFQEQHLNTPRNQNSRNSQNIPYVKKILPSPRGSKTKFNMDTNVVTNYKEKKEPHLEKQLSENFCGTNTLKEIMKQKRAELKNQKQDEVIWIGKEIKKEEKEEKEEIKNDYKFPEVIILEKPRKSSIKEKKTQNENRNTIDMTEAKNKYSCVYDSQIIYKQKKEAEEFYNLNRYLEELNKINEEETSETSNVDILNIDIKSSDENSDNTREYGIEDVESSNSNSAQGINNDINTDNTQIEELRVDLENCLGNEVFKIVYKIVDQQTDRNVIKYNGEAINYFILKTMEGKHDHKTIELAIEKVPDVFVLVARERLMEIKPK